MDQQLCGDGEHDNNSKLGHNGNGGAHNDNQLNDFSNVYYIMLLCAY